jgi:hypothetical protein
VSGVAGWRGRADAVDLGARAATGDDRQRAAHTGHRDRQTLAVALWLRRLNIIDILGWVDERRG